jgi:hypothetical protein
MEKNVDLAVSPRQARDRHDALGPYLSIGGELVANARFQRSGFAVTPCTSGPLDQRVGAAAKLQFLEA